MIRRGPILPPNRYLWITVLLVLPMGSAAHIWRDEGAAGVPLVWKLTWVGLALFPTAFAFAAHFLLKSLQGLGLDIEQPRWRNWLLYYGCFFVAAVLGSVARDGLRDLLFRVPVTGLQRLVGTLTMAYLLVWFAYFMEMHAVFRREIRAKLDQSMAAVRDTFLSQELHRVMQARTRHELLWVFEQQLPRQLADVQAQIAAFQERLSAGVGEKSRDDALLAALDAIRDGSIRRISHLLHPSIIDVGLLPALRSLAMSMEELNVAVLADEATQRMDEAGRNVIPHAIRLAAYRIAEQALNHLARQVTRQAEIRLRHAGDEGLELEVRADEACLSEATMKEISLAVMQSRISLVGGALSFEEASLGQSVLVARLPLTRSGEA